MAEREQARKTPKKHHFKKICVATTNLERLSDEEATQLEKKRENKNRNIEVIEKTRKIH